MKFFLTQEEIAKYRKKKSQIDIEYYIARYDIFDSSSGYWKRNKMTGVWVVEYPTTKAKNLHDEVGKFIEELFQQEQATISSVTYV